MALDTSILAAVDALLATAGVDGFYQNVPCVAGAPAAPEESQSDSRSGLHGGLPPPQRASGAPPSSVPLLARLRAIAPGLRITCCDESDVGVDAPFRIYPAFHLHLVDGTQHCWVLTSDPAQATALLVARRRGAR